MSRKNLIEYLYKEMCYHGFGDFNFWVNYFDYEEDSLEYIIDWINVDYQLCRSDIPKHLLNKAYNSERMDVDKLLLSLLSSFPPNLS